MFVFLFLFSDIVMSIIMPNKHFLTYLAVAYKKKNHYISGSQCFNIIMKAYSNMTSIFFISDKTTDLLSICLFKAPIVVY